MLLHYNILLLFKACNMNNILVDYSFFSLENHSISVGHAEFCMMKNHTCTKCNTELHKKYSDMSQIFQLFCFYKLCLLSFSIMEWIWFALNWYFLYGGIHQSETLLQKKYINWWGPAEKPVLRNPPPKWNFPVYGCRTLSMTYKVYHCNSIIVAISIHTPISDHWFVKISSLPTFALKSHNRICHLV
jgi:hypothetical protein